MLSPKRAAFALVAVLCMGNLWTSLVRSGIPLAIDGKVSSLEVRAEKHPGVDDVHLVGVGGRVLHLDKTLAEQLEVGETLRKKPWSMTLLQDGRTVEIGPSRDFYGMLVAMILLIGMARLLTASTS